MTQRLNDLSDAASLRHRAEEQMARQTLPETGERTADETSRLVHELQVHQIELEMQNNALRESRDEVESLLARYIDLYDLAPVGYLTVDRSGAIMQINLTGARLLDLDRSHLVRRRFGLFVDPNERAAFTNFLEQLFVTGAVEACEFALPRVGTADVVLRIDGTRDADSARCRLVLTDVTARHAADQLVRLQSAALNATADAVMITDRNGRIEWVNAGFSNLTGYGSAEAVGRNPRDLVRSGLQDEAFYALLWRTILGHGLWRGDLTNRRRDGTHYLTGVSITAVRDAQDEVTHFVAIARDLTVQRQMEAELMQANKIESVGRLAGGIAHDFNNLLTVINTTADLAITTLPDDNPLRADLQNIILAGGRAAALTHQLLALSRKQIMKLEPVNLSTLVKGIEGMLQRLAGERTTLTVRLADHARRVMVDPNQIEQVLLNLVANARDAMPDGGTVTIETHDIDIDQAMSAEFAPLQPGPHVTLTVHDTGSGMDAPTLAHLFEPFFTTKPIGKGTGLGLSTAQGILAQCGGCIRVQSAPDHGTTVTAYLPRSDYSEPGAQPDAAAMATPATPATLAMPGSDGGLAVAHAASA